MNIKPKSLVKKNTIDFVFHGSGSSIDEIREAIDYGGKNEYRHRLAVCLHDRS